MIAQRTSRVIIKSPITLYNILNRCAGTLTMLSSLITLLRVSRYSLITMESILLYFRNTRLLPLTMSGVLSNNGFYRADRGVIFFIRRRYISFRIRSPFSVICSLYSFAVPPVYDVVGFVSFVGLWMFFVVRRNRHCRTKGTMCLPDLSVKRLFRDDTNSLFGTTHSRRHRPRDQDKS